MGQTGLGRAWIDPHAFQQLQIPGQHHRRLAVDSIVEVEVVTVLMQYRHRLTTQTLVVVQHPDRLVTGLGRTGQHRHRRRRRTAQFRLHQYTGLQWQ